MFEPKAFGFEETLELKLLAEGVPEYENLESTMTFLEILF